MALTDTKIRNSKPQDKAYKLTDEKGLFLHIQLSGAKYWRLKYRFLGKEKLLALGVYPEISLAEARDLRDEARKLLLNNTDPGIEKQLGKRTAKLAAENTFKLIALEWHSQQSSLWVAKHTGKVKRRLELHIFPWIGHKPVNDISPAELLSVVRRIEGKGSIDTAHSAFQNCGQIFRYAIATQRAAHNPTNDLRGALQPIRRKHHAAITEPKAISGLLRATYNYDGHYVTKYALKLAPLLFVRPGELRKAEWSEIDFNAAEWKIPGSKMKMREPHIVPLAKQAVTILHSLHKLTGNSKYVFPGLRTNDRPMSENTVNGALRRLGYAKDDMTGHGFRSMASTRLNEQGWNRDAIERQLAHAERDSIRAAYNYAEYLVERRKMMQSWADYLDTLVASA